MDQGVRDPARIPRYAVIPTNGRDCLLDCVNAIAPQVDLIALIMTAEVKDSTWWALRKPPEGILVLSDRDGVNISRWWNRGLDYLATKPEATKWDVAIINDDVIVPEGWFDAVSGAMRGMQVAAGCSGGRGPMPVLQTQPGPVNLFERMQGFAFMVAGERGLRANEEFRWYYSDDFMDWESRRLGGMVMIPGFHVQHLYPNQQVTGEMQVMIAEDAQKFHDLYGGMPW